MEDGDTSTVANVQVLEAVSVDDKINRDRIPLSSERERLSDTASSVSEVIDHLPSREDVVREEEEEERSFFPTSSSLPHHHQSSEVASLPPSSRSSSRKSSPSQHASYPSSYPPPPPRAGGFQPMSNLWSSGERETGMSEKEEELEKQTVLLDLERLKMQGVRLSREFTIEDRLSDLRFEAKRHMMHIDEMHNVSTLKDAIRLGCTGIEMINRRFRIMNLDGWSQEFGRDLGKYDATLSRLYRKYWRRGVSQAPEMDLLVGLVTSMIMFHFRKKINSQIFPTAQASLPRHQGSRPSSSPSPPPRRVSPLVEDDSEDEESEEEAPP